VTIDLTILLRYSAFKFVTGVLEAVQSSFISKKLSLKHQFIMPASNANSPPRRVRVGLLRGQHAVTESKWEMAKTKGMKKTGKKEETEVKSN